LISEPERSEFVESRCQVKRAEVEVETRMYDARCTEASAGEMDK